MLKHWVKQKHNDKQQRLKGVKRASLFLMVLAVLISSFSPHDSVFADEIEPSPLLSAHSEPYLSSFTPTQMMRSYVYYTLFGYCMNTYDAAHPGWTPFNDDISKVLASDAVAGNWFSNSVAGITTVASQVVGQNPPFTTVGGYSLSLDTIGVSCTDSGWINDAATLWGYGSTLAMFCDAGVYRMNGQEDCINGTGDFRTKTNIPLGVLTNPAGSIKVVRLDWNEFSLNIKNKIYLGLEPSLATSQAKYIWARNNLFGGCIGTPFVDATNPAQSVATDPNDDHMYYTILANSDGTITVDEGGNPTVKYYGTKALGESINADLNVQNIMFGFNGLVVNTYKCSALLTMMNDNAQSYANWLLQNENTNAGKTETDTADITPGGTDTTTTCGVDGVGWLVCPIVRFLGNIANDAFQFLADNFLEVQPSLLSTTDSTGSVSGQSAVYEAWGQIRTIANILFVIVFLIIIFSQVTGFGIDNYGIKKMFPQLILIAVLVNLSFYACQIVVDLSNILGHSITQIFQGITPNNLIPVGGSGDALNTWASSGGGFSDSLITAVLVGVGGAIIWVNLAALIPVLIGAVIALVMILLMLVARKALIVILVILAPLALMAMLFPGTKKLFSQYVKMYGALLLLFPIISLVFGASTFVSTILQSTFKDTMGQILGAAITTLPLFVVPMILMKSLDAIGNIGGTINGLRTKLSGMAGKAGATRFEASRLGQFNKYRKNQANRRNSDIRAGIYKGRMGKFNPRNWRNSMNKGFNESWLAGGSTNLAVAAGLAASDKAEKENIANATIRMDHMGLDATELKAISQGGKVRGMDGSDFAVRSAAIQRVVASNDIAGMNALWDQASTGVLNENERRVFGDALQASSNRPQYFGMGAVAQMRLGKNMKSSETIIDAVQKNAYSSTKMATADNEELKEVWKQAQSDDATRESLVSTAKAALADKIIGPTIAKNKETVIKISNNDYQVPGQTVISYGNTDNTNNANPNDGDMNIPH